MILLFYIFLPIKWAFYTSEDLKPHPKGVLWFKVVTGNLQEISSAMRIEMFKGINEKMCKWVTFRGGFIGEPSIVYPIPLL